MKNSVIIVISCFLLFSSCSNDSATTQNVKYFWHLVNVTGGFAGINEQFSLETIVWAFNDATATLTVDNKNNDDSIEDGFDSGTYEFSVLDVNNKTYLVVNDNEMGSFEISQNTLIINQNEMSMGSGADGFVYTFQVEVVVID